MTEIDPALVQYLVQGDSFAVWEHFHRGVQWEQLNPGFLAVIGRLKDVKGEECPISVDVSFNRINGQVIAFYGSPSKVTDWDVVHAYVKDYFPNAKGKTNAMNFHLALDDLGIKVEMSPPCQACGRWWP